MARSPQRRTLAETRSKATNGFTLAALNLLNLHDWYAKHERLDPWGRFLGEPGPAHRTRKWPRHFASRRHEEPSDSARSGR